MRKIVLTLSLIAVVTVAWSQDSRRGGQRPEKPSSEEMIKQATKELSLSDDQVEQWIKIHEKYESALTDQSKVHETRQALGKELEATLSEEQLRKFKKMRGKQRPPRRGN